MNQLPWPLRILLIAGCLALVLTFVAEVMAALP